MRGSIAERRLINRLKAGDAAAVSDLATRYGAKIHQLAFRYMRNREDAEEVAQDVLMKVWRGIVKFGGRSALSSWIHRITFNAAMSRLRTRSHRAEGHDEHVRRSNDGGDVRDASRERVDLSPRADELLLNEELRGTFLQAMLDLPVIYREPIVLRDLRGLSTEQAAATLGINDQTLKSRLHRGRLILRERLADFADRLAA